MSCLFHVFFFPHNLASCKCFLYEGTISELSRVQFGPKAYACFQTKIAPIFKSQYFISQLHNFSQYMFWFNLAPLCFWGKVAKFATLWTLSFISFEPLDPSVSCILFLLTLSSLNYTFRIGEKRKWLLTQEAPNFQTIHPWEHLRKCIEKSMETMHTDVKLQKVTLTSNFQ